jgi:hypothetical protein
MLTLGLCAGVAAGVLGLGGAAEARVNVPRTSSQMAWECGLYQDAYDQAKKDLKNATTELQRVNAQNALDRAVDNWYKNGCYELFGRLSPLVNGGSLHEGQIEAADNPQTAPARQVTTAPVFSSELGR